jgi:cysteine desulfurase
MSKQRIKTKFEKAKCDTPVVYLDNNSSVLIHPEAKQVMTSWMSCYNPATSSKYSKDGKVIIDRVKNEIQKINKCQYEIIFTSGATESNCFILRSVADAYMRKRNQIPHIITSSIEHHSTMECVEQLQQSNKITVSIIEPNIYGEILPENVEKSIRADTALISIMYGQNELGTINNVPEIGNIAHKHKIPMHSDCVQIYGKYRLDLPKHKIDACSVSVHKFGGPKGIGLLIINKDLIQGYGLEAMINGSQQGGLRGGTQDVAAIAATGEALRVTFSNRDAKNKKMRSLVNYMVKELSKLYDLIDYNTILKTTDSASAAADQEPQKEVPVSNHGNSIKGGSASAVESSSTDKKKEKDKDKEKKKEETLYKICILGPPIDYESRLPNTLMISVIKNPIFNKKETKPFCNVLFKQALDKEGMVVSIGSACLTSNMSASHVLKAIKAPQIVLNGALRLSLCDNTTKEDIDTAVKIFNKVLQNLKV